MAPEATPTPGQALKLPQPEATALSTTDKEQTGSAVNTRSEDPIIIKQGGSIQAEGGPKESAPVDG